MENQKTPQKDYGKLSKEGNKYFLSYEREIDHPVTKVWSAITDPTLMAIWLAEVKMKPIVGEPIEIKFANGGVIKGKVTKVKENELLEYTWKGNDSEPESFVRWKLSKLGDNKTKLNFSAILPDSLSMDIMKSASTSWHIILDMLVEYVDGKVTKHNWPTEKWNQLLQDYKPM